MKKENNEKNNDLFDSFIPEHTKDDPNLNLKKEKKLFGIIFIVVCSLLIAANLISMIIHFCAIDLVGGFSALFVGTINCVISIFLLGLLITVSHNISKMTRATLFICSKLMRDEKRCIEAEKERKAKANKEKEKTEIVTEKVEKDIDTTDNTNNSAMDNLDETQSENQNIYANDSENESEDAIVVITDVVDESTF